MQRGAPDLGRQRRVEESDHPRCILIGNGGESGDVPHIRNQPEREVLRREGHIALINPRLVIIEFARNQCYRTYDNNSWRTWRLGGSNGFCF